MSGVPSEEAGGEEATVSSTAGHLSEPVLEHAASFLNSVGKTQEAVQHTGKKMSAPQESREQQPPLAGAHLSVAAFPHFSQLADPAMAAPQWRLWLGCLDNYFCVTRETDGAVCRHLSTARAYAMAAVREHSMAAADDTGQPVVKEE
ncbi:hypothetical protein NDU88_010812 [Pleurodeles waltl]|uniref:SWIM-type domain-containing protein n=1 Tax=Pleurodeles waltl TaxID=8319 RepID=A0AAV7QZW4_PLEWA|nr:hypothetical protein NDU88_010812 [Pleurodeles waltl]